MNTKGQAVRKNLKSLGMPNQLVKLLASLGARQILPVQRGSGTTMVLVINSVLLLEEVKLDRWLQGLELTWAHVLQQALDLDLSTIIMQGFLSLVLVFALPAHLRLSRRSKSQLEECVYRPLSQRLRSLQRSV